MESSITTESDPVKTSAPIVPDVNISISSTEEIVEDKLPSKDDEQKEDEPIQNVSTSSEDEIDKLVAAEPSRIDLDTKSKNIDKVAETNTNSEPIKITNIVTLNSEDDTKSYEPDTVKIDSSAEKNDNAGDEYCTSTVESVHSVDSDDPIDLDPSKLLFEPDPSIVDDFEMIVDEVEETDEVEEPDEEEEEQEEEEVELLMPTDKHKEKPKSDSSIEVLDDSEDDDIDDDDVDDDDDDDDDDEDDTIITETEKIIPTNLSQGGIHKPHSIDDEDDESMLDEMESADEIDDDDDDDISEDDDDEEDRDEDVISNICISDDSVDQPIDPSVPSTVPIDVIRLSDKSEMYEINVKSKTDSLRKLSAKSVVISKRSTRFSAGKRIKRTLNITQKLARRSVKWLNQRRRAMHVIDDKSLDTNMEVDLSMSAATIKIASVETVSAALQPDIVLSTGEKTKEIIKETGNLLNEKENVQPQVVNVESQASTHITTDNKLIDISEHIDDDDCISIDDSPVKILNGDKSVEKVTSLEIDGEEQISEPHQLTKNSESAVFHVELTDSGSIVKKTPRNTDVQMFHVDLTDAGSIVKQATSNDVQINEPLKENVEVKATKSIEVSSNTEECTNKEETLSTDITDSNAFKEQPPDKNNDLISLNLSTIAINKESMKKSSSNESQVEPNPTQENNIDLSQQNNIGKEEMHLTKENHQSQSAPVSTKRTHPDDCIDDLSSAPPSKRLCAELEANFGAHDRLLREYIESTTNNTLDDVQKNIDDISIDIQVLNELARAKELEWNNILHLKTAKEEIVQRLLRKRKVMEIMSAQIGEVADYSIVEQSTNFASQSISKRITKEITNNNTSLSFNNTNISMMPLLTSTPSTGNMTSSSVNLSGLSTTQAILNNRANMKSSDLAKEKANTQRLHRLLFPRNILPKPAHTGGSTVTATTVPTPIGTHSLPTNFMTSIPLTTQTQHLLNTDQQHQKYLQNVTNSQQHNQQYMQQQQKLQQNAAIQQLINGHNVQIGRQGVIKDVRSIIDDYRQQHPETVPRRGRRMKNIHNNNNIPNSSQDSGTGINAARMASDAVMARQLVMKNRMDDLGALLVKYENNIAGGGNSRPSSNDSSHSNSNTGTGQQQADLNLSFKDVMAQFAKIAQQPNDRVTVSSSGILAGLNLTTNNSTAGTMSNKMPPTYPEVTLHPVHSETSGNKPSAPTSSLLHGILTKQHSNSRPTSAGFTTFSSPTLARLLTAPERKAPLSTVKNFASNPNPINHPQPSGINLTKSNSEITITPVLNAINSQSLHQTILQQQLMKYQQQQDSQPRIKSESYKAEGYSNLEEDEADDSVDRLVIDEGDANHEQPQPLVNDMSVHEMDENEVPECQGCKKREAQFVCAGCGNQWYCSRSCQVAAWDEHCEVCTE